MSFAITALLPVFLTIVLGFGLKRTGLVTEEQWHSLDHIAYYVLFPAIVSRAIIVADYSGVPFIRMALAMILAILTMAGLLTLARPFLQRALAITPASFSSVFQGSMRWHAFIALAIVPALYGAPGLALIAVAAAAIIPVINVACVWGLAAWADWAAAAVFGHGRRTGAQSLHCQLRGGPGGQGDGPRVAGERHHHARSGRARGARDAPC